MIIKEDMVTIVGNPKFISEISAIIGVKDVCSQIDAAYTRFQQGEKIRVMNSMILKQL